MGLLDLIEEDHGIGLSPDSLGQLTALLVAHIAGRRTDQSGYRILLHVLRHIDTHHGIFIIKEVLGQRLGELCLADAGRSHEEEGADGLGGILDAGLGPENGLRHALHGLVLTDETLMNGIAQMQHLGTLGLIQLRHRDTGPAADDPGNLILGHPIMHQLDAVLLLGQLLSLLQGLRHGRQILILQLCGLLVIKALLGDVDLGIDLVLLLPQRLDLADGVLLILPLGLLDIEAVLQLGKLLGQLLKPFLRQGIVLLLQCQLLDLQLHDPPVQLIHLLRHGIHLRLDQGTGLIHQVDGLVRQETVGNVPVGKRRCCHQCGIGDLHAVIDLITLLDASQDGNGVLHRGLVHHDRLETPLQCRILFDVLMILLQGGGTDAVQLAPGQQRLQQVARIHGALGLAGTHNVVNLINKHDDLAIGLLHLIQYGLQTLLEFTPVLGAGNQRTHIQRENLLILQRIRHVSLGDTLCQSLNSRGLADTRLTDQAGVVLGFPGQDPHHVPDLLITTDDGVELLGLGPLHHFVSVLV